MLNRDIIKSSIDAKQNPCGKGKSYPRFKQMGNDALWRSGTPELLKQMASVSYSNPIGSTIPASQVSIPGIARITLRPHYGYAVGGSSALQIAADAQFQYITQGYTGTNPSFMASDLFCYQRAGLDGIYVLIEEMMRALGLTKKFSVVNDFLARHLVTACGFDYDDLKKYQADIEAELNTVIEEINEKFKFVAESNIRKIKQNMFSRIFSDDPGNKYQMYVFVPEGYPAFDENLPNGSALVFEPRPETLSRAGYFALLEKLIGKLRNNQDISIMSGAILRTYKESGCMTIPQFKVAETPIDFDHVMLSEIHNIKFLDNTEYSGFEFWFSDGTDVSVQNSTYLVYQDNAGMLKSTPMVVSLSGSNAPSDAQRVAMLAYLSSQSILDIPATEPTCDDTCDALSFKFGSILRAAPNPNYGFNVYINGSTDLAVGMKLYTLNSETKALISVDLKAFDFVINGITGQRFIDYLRLACFFDYMPFIQINRDPTRTLSIVWDFIGDIFNFTYVDNEFVNNFMNRSWKQMLNTPVNIASVT